jgi:hypothetical protein
VILERQQTWTQLLGSAAPLAKQRTFALCGCSPAGLVDCVFGLIHALVTSRLTLPSTGGQLQINMRQAGSSLAQRLWQSLAWSSSECSSIASSSGGFAAALEDVLLRMGRRDPKTRRGKVCFIFRTSFHTCRIKPLGRGWPTAAAATAAQASATSVHELPALCPGSLCCRFSRVRMARCVVPTPVCSTLPLVTDDVSCPPGPIWLPPSYQCAAHRRPRFFAFALQARPRKSPLSNPYLQPPQPQQTPIPYPPGWQPASVAEGGTVLT